MGFLSSLFGRNKEQAMASKREITEQLQQRILERFPHLKALVINANDDNEIAIEITKDGEHVGSMFPDNLYATYQTKDKEAYEQYVEQLLKSLPNMINRSTSDNAEQLAEETLLPCIKNLDWLEQMTQLSKGTAPVFKPIAGDLILVFALDSESQMRFLMDDEDQTQSFDDLFAQAMENFHQRVREIRLQGGVTEIGVRLELDNDYDSSLALVTDDLLESLELEGEPVLGIFSRALFVIADSAKPEQVKELQNFANTQAAELPYALSTHLYTFKDSTITLYAGELAS